MTGTPLEPRPPRVSLRHKIIFTGIYTGVLLNVVMFGALVAANRVLGLEQYALERNAVSYSAFVIFMLIPILRFFTRPLPMFASAMIGWFLFAIGYDIAGMFFHDLFDSLRHTPFLAVVEGAVVYGVFAVGSWVGGMIMQVRRNPAPLRRQRANHVAEHAAQHHP
jgi:hypothetical protein